jgi:hypothetical protein
MWGTDMAVQWGLGVPQVDIGQQFQAGMDHGRQVRQIQDRQNALRGYAANPNDPSAQNALLVADPQLATNLEDQRFQRSHAEHQAAIDALTQHRDRIIMGAQFLQGVRDEAGYQQALALARQNGIQIDDVPQHYDPQYVQGLLTVAQHLQAVAHPQNQQPPNIQREVEYYRSIGRDDLAQQILTRHAEGPPSVASNGDGTFTILPAGVTHPQGTGGASQAGQTATNPQTGERIRFNPSTGQWEPLTQGGAPQPQAAGTFR